MNISGIRPHAGFYNYSRTGIEEQKSRQDENLRNEKPQSGESAGEKAINEKIAATSKADKEKYGYPSPIDVGGERPDITYGRKGSGSSLADLDMEKAISDMQRDRLLRQYQFFVGNSRQKEDVMKQSPLLPEENFNL